jgi:hypothetical protein
LALAFFAPNLLVVIDYLLLLSSRYGRFAGIELKFASMISD